MATRRSDSELDTYHGGREAYLNSMRESLEKAKAETYVPGDIFATTFGQDTAEEFEAHKARKIAEYEAAIAANS